MIHHSPFKAANSDEFRELTKSLSELEQVVMDNPGVRDYYRESMGLTDMKSVGAAVDPIDPVNLIVMQIQLMEDAYFSLRLDQFANARDNRGWMNLFRQWAHSATFQAHFQKLQTVYSSDFVASTVITSTTGKRSTLSPCRTRGTCGGRRRPSPVGPGLRGNAVGVALKDCSSTPDGVMLARRRRIRVQ